MNNNLKMNGVVENMRKPENKNYRICHDFEGTKFYELNKYCNCEGCNSRMKVKRSPSNAISVKTKDITKVDMMAEFLKGWSCDDGSMILERAFLTF